MPRQSESKQDDIRHLHTYKPDGTEAEEDSKEVERWFRRRDFPTFTSSFFSSPAECTFQSIMKHSFDVMNSVI